MSTSPAPRTVSSTGPALSKCLLVEGTSALITGSDHIPADVLLKRMWPTSFTHEHASESLLLIILCFQAFPYLDNYSLCGWPEPGTQLKCAVHREAQFPNGQPIMAKINSKPQQPKSTILIISVTSFCHTQIFFSAVTQSRKKKNKKNIQRCAHGLWVCVRVRVA